MSISKNRIFLLLLSGAFLLSACDKQQEPFSASFPVRHAASGSSSTVPEDPIPDDDPDPGPGPVTYPTLLSVLDKKIAEYANDENAPLNHVYICAHRANTAYGKSNDIPENSVWAIETAIEKGADMVELDVALTSDGVLMIMHDDALSTTTDGSGNIGSKTYGQVKALRMHPRGKSSTYPMHNGDYVRVPTLKEALDACKDKIYVNLDTKGRELPIADVLDAIDKSGTMGQVMIFGQGDEAKKSYISAAFSNYRQKLAIHPYINTPDALRGYLIKSYNGCCRLFQYGTEIYYTPTIERFGFSCHAQGGLSYSNSLDYDSQISGWSSGACKVLDRFIASGSDFLQTDYCEKADAYLTIKGLR